MTAAFEEIQLNWLRAFLAVDATGSFTAAGSRVHRAQSRVSAQVAELERHLGVSLFARGRVPVQLTDAGEEFRIYAQSVLHELEAGVAAVTSRNGVIRGRVTVSAYPGASAFLVAPVVTKFCQLYPQAQIGLYDTLRDQGSAVVHGDVDLAIRPAYTEPGAHSLDIRALFREPIVCIVPPDHPAAQFATITADALTGETVVMTGGVEAGAGRYSALLEEFGAKPAREVVVGQPTTVTALVSAGLGIGILPALAAHLMGTERIKPICIRGDAFSRDVTLITNRSRRYPPVVQEFIKQLMTEPLHPALLPIDSTSFHPDDAHTHRVSHRASTGTSRLNHLSDE